MLSYWNYVNTFIVKSKKLKARKIGLKTLSVVLFEYCKSGDSTDWERERERESVSEREWEARERTRRSREHVVLSFFNLNAFCRSKTSPANREPQWPTTPSHTCQRSQQSASCCIGGSQECCGPRTSSTPHSPSTQRPTIGRRPQQHGQRSNRRRRSSNPTPPPCPLRKPPTHPPRLLQPPASSRQFLP